MTLSRNHILRVFPAVLLFAGGCKSTPTAATDATATTTTTPTATVTAIPSLETVVVTPSTNSAYAWSGSFSVTITNTNTAALIVKSITADLQQSSGGIAITPLTGTDESFRFDVRAPGNRVDVNGSMAIPFTFYYTLPNGGREAIVNLSFTVATEAGATGSVTSTVNLQ